MGETLQVPVCQLKQSYERVLFAVLPKSDVHKTMLIDANLDAKSSRLFSRRERLNCPAKQTLGLHFLFDDLPQILNLAYFNICVRIAHRCGYHRAVRQSLPASAW